MLCRMDGHLVKNPKGMVGGEASPILSYANISTFTITDHKNSEFLKILIMVIIQNLKLHD